MQMDQDDLTEDQQAVVRRLASSEGSLDLLRQVFNDPGEAFVVSPVPISMRELSRMYLDQFPEDERHGVPRLLRQRSREERWVEKRAVFQARRIAVRKDAMLDVEGEVWAILGIEFHARRIRSLMERWEALDAYVMRGLEGCEAGDNAFGTGLRDACRELNAIEEKLAEIMPSLGLSGRAQQFWSAKAGGRKEIIQRIRGHLASVSGADKAGRVFELIEGGMDSE
jgi:hypothetical protein